MGAVIVLVVVLFVIALGALLLSAARRRDLGTATGELSRETKKRDRRTAPLAPSAPPVTGRELERAVALERRQGGAVEQARPAAPVPYVPADPETVGVTRRQFFNRSIVAFMGLSLSGFGAAVLAFLWPQVTGGFGAAIRIGSVEDVKNEIARGGGFYYRADGRMWITEYPAGSLERARGVYSPSELRGMEAGLIALYQKCPHLGCRVPECTTSQWFECGCHGSQFNRVGERRGGPAPRGMDRFAMSVDGGAFVVDTGTIIPGPPSGTNTTGQEAEGPNCVGAAEH
jgi:cytochrome b6-f complex iron-sulfur subunit